MFICKWNFQGTVDSSDLKQSFIAAADEVDEIIRDDDNHDDDGSSADDNQDDEPDLFDSVCAICDNGGDLLWYVSFILFDNLKFLLHIQVTIC